MENSFLKERVGRLEEQVEMLADKIAAVQRQRAVLLATKDGSHEIHGEWPPSHGTIWHVTASGSFFCGQNGRAPCRSHFNGKNGIDRRFFLMSISFGVNLNSLNLY